jgi:hypothetical protein
VGQACFGCLTLTLSLSRFAPDLERTMTRPQPRMLNRAGKPKLMCGRGLRFRPPCPDCDMAMITVASSTDRAGHEHRGFECLRCGMVETTADILIVSRRFVVGLKAELCQAPGRLRKNDWQSSSPIFLASLLQFAFRSLPKLLLSIFGVYRSLSQILRAALSICSSRGILAPENDSRMQT